MTHPFFYYMYFDFLCWTWFICFPMNLIIAWVHVSGKCTHFISQSLTLTFIYMFVCLLPFEPLHAFLPPLTTPSLATTDLFSVSMSSRFWRFFGSTYKWDHTVYVYLSDLFHLFHNALKFHPCCRKWQDFIIFYGWVVFHCIYVPHLLHPFICQ